MSIGVCEIEQIVFVLIMWSISFGRVRRRAADQAFGDSAQCVVFETAGYVFGAGHVHSAVQDAGFFASEKPLHASSDTIS